MMRGCVKHPRMRKDAYNMKYTHDSLTDAIIKDVEFFGDTSDRCAIYAMFKDNANNLLFVNIDDNKFHSFLRISAHKKAPSFNNFNATRAATYIRDWFNMGEYLECVEVFVRTAGGLENGVVYDLIDTKQQAVVIGENGWEITMDKPCKFLSSTTSLSQVEPEKTDEDVRDLLKPFINLKGDDYLMTVLWLIHSYCNSKHSALLIMAERGSGKSTLCRILQLLLDPSRLDVTMMPSKKDDLQTILTSTYLACFDNVANIKKDISDVLCVAITGGTTSKRTLYTDSGLTIQKLHNTVVLNGIDIVPKEADLAERLLMINLVKLDSTKIKREQDFWKAFNEARPRILGSIFNVLSAAMRIRKTLVIKNMPRMADSFADMLCIAIAMGITEEEFRAMYDRNVEKMKIARGNKPLIEAIREYIATVPGRKVEGYVSHLYSEIKNNYSGNKNLLPKSASNFSKELELERDTLLSFGIKVNTDDTSDKGTHMQIIKMKS